MRILLIKNVFLDSALGGAEILCHNIVDSLSARGHELFILSAGPESRSVRFNVEAKLKRIKPAVQNIQLSTLARKITWAINSLRNYRITRRYINKIKPDVIYLHNLEWVTYSPLSAAVESGNKVIIHLHNHSYFQLWESCRGGLYKGGMRGLFHLSPTFANVHLIAISHAIAQEFRNSGYPENKILTIYNGLPRAAFDRSLIDAGRKNILFVGEIEPHKGVDVAINAIGLLKEQGTPCSLEIIGPSRNNRYREKLETIIAKHALNAHIRFIGGLPREEVWERMRGAEVLLFPTIWQEPFGLVAAEAMACGAYIVASNRGALPEVVGECGSLVEPTPEACAESVRKYLALSNQEKDTLRNNAFNRAFHLFDLEKNISFIEQILLS